MTDAQGALTLDALVASLDGHTVIRASGAGEDPLEVGGSVAEALLSRGAGPVLEAAIAAAESGDP